MTQTNTSLLWWAITGRIPGDEEDSCRVIQSATEQEAHAEFAQQMFDAEMDPAAARLVAVKESGNDLGVYITSSIWSRTQINLTSDQAAPHPVQPEDSSFRAEGQYVRGPARPSGSGFKEFVIKLGNPKLATMTAETLNEFATLWARRSAATGRGRLPADILAATEAGELDELADHIHPDVINQFCDAVQAMQQDRLEKAKALGFASVEQMYAHEAWQKQIHQAHQEESVFQATAEAQMIRDDANVPTTTWVSATCANKS